MLKSLIQGGVKHMPDVRVDIRNDVHLPPTVTLGDKWNTCLM